MAESNKVLENLPEPPEDGDDPVLSECRLWVGNLDQRINEFTMLKLLQKYGSLEHFNFLYHKTGPDQGKPRGYCFATYATKEEADKAQKGLNGKLALSKKLIVKSAKPHTETPAEAPKPSAAIGTVKDPTTSVTTTVRKETSNEAKIRAIQAKLEQMEKGESSVAPGSVVAELAHSYGHNPTNSGQKTSSSSSGKSHKEFSYKRQRHVYNKRGRRR